MSLDFNELVRAVKQAALEAVQADNPIAVCYGTVTAVGPLEITTDQKLVLKEELLLLTDNVRDYNVELSTISGSGSAEGPHYTESESGGSGYAEFASHAHRYQGRKKWKVHNALKMGERVILLRCDGGQRFIVLDRWEARK